MVEEKVVQFRPRSLCAQSLSQSSVLKQIEAALPIIMADPIETAGESIDGKELAYGAYNQPIYYLANGKAHHAAGEHIDSMRELRSYTHNAIELRCDALGLAIYISGCLQIDHKVIAPKQNGNPVGRGVRVVIYHYRQKEPTERIAMKSPAEVLKKLHATLLNTFNRVANDYNVTGMRDGCLVLRSSSHLFPDIPLGLNEMEGA